MDTDMDIDEIEETKPQGNEVYSSIETAKKGMLRPATVTDGQMKVGGIGASHGDVSRPAKNTSGVDQAMGFVTPEGKFLSRQQSLEWLQKNRPHIYPKLDDITTKNGLESQDYAHAEGVTSETDELINAFLSTYHL